MTRGKASATDTGYSGNHKTHKREVISKLLQSSGSKAVSSLKKPVVQAYSSGNGVAPRTRRPCYPGFEIASILSNVDGYFSRAELTAFIEEKSLEDEDFYDVCRGHDCLQLLPLMLVNVNLYSAPLIMLKMKKHILLPILKKLEYMHLLNNGKFMRALKYSTHSNLSSFGIVTLPLGFARLCGSNVPLQGGGL